MVDVEGYFRASMCRERVLFGLYSSFVGPGFLCFCITAVFFGTSFLLLSVVVFVVFIFLEF